MERMKLRTARVERKLSQTRLAQKIGYSREAVNAWERGKMDPAPDAIEALRIFFDRNPADLDLAKALTKDEQKMIEEILKNRTVDRRQALAIIALPAFAGVDLPSKALISPEKMLNQCNVAIKACWQLMKYGGFTEVDYIITEYLPTLSDLANVKSDHQGMAASLAVQAKILEGKLAWHRMDFLAHETACTDAVRFGELTGDPYVHATAILYMAYAYMVCRPYRLQKAIDHFNDALRIISGEASFLHVDIYVSLANAYALRKQIASTEKALTQAESLLSSEMQQFPQFLYGEGYTGFYREKGKAYLALAPHDKKYFQLAYDAFSRDAPASTRSAGEVAILRADAARGIENFHEFVEWLRKGILIAIQFDSEKRRSEVRKVLGKVPGSWKSEQSYKELVKML